MHTILKRFFSLLVISLAACAMSAAVTASGPDYTVTPNMPDNMRDASAGYFDLMMQPGQEQDLTVSINNPTDKDAFFTVEAITATTNRNGNIDYDNNGSPDESMKHSFADIATVKEAEMTIPANSTQDAVVTVKMPQEEYDGMILGAIRILKPADENDVEAETDEASGTAISNQYSYVFGVAMVVKEGETAIEPDFMMGGTEAKLDNLRIAVVNQIRNPKPMYYKGIEVFGQVFEEGSDTPLFEVTMPQVDMAPNSVFDFTMTDDAGYGLPAGKYTSKINVKYEGKAWELGNDFEVAPQESAELAASAINTPQSTLAQNAPSRLAEESASTPAWLTGLIIFGCVLLLGALGFFSWTMIKMRRDNKAYSSQNDHNFKM